MTSNTVEIESHPVNFPSFSVERRTHKPDPFTIRNGRFVGSDGFVVPKDFREFFRRFPDYVHRWISKHAPSSATVEDKEDWTQDLLIHLSCLPLTSKYREANKKDIIATFDPLRHYGANEARFRSYINLCLANKFRTMHSKRERDALCRAGNLSLGGEIAGEDPCSVDELCHKHSAHLRAAQKSCQKQSHDRAFLQEFLNLVRREDAKALPTIEALMATGTRGEAAYWLGVAELEFDRMHTRVRRLGRCFVSGEPVPKQRKPYRRRREPSAGDPGGLKTSGGCPEHWIVDGSVLGNSSCAIPTLDDHVDLLALCVEPLESKPINAQMSGRPKGDLRSPFSTRCPTRNVFVL
jgi:hypothetical protein